MNIAGMAFLYVAIGTSAAALAFLVAQRSSGKTSSEVEGCYEHATLLESVERDLRSLCDDAKKGAPAEGREDLERARMQLEDAIAGLRRGADLVV